MKQRTNIKKNHCSKASPLERFGEACLFITTANGIASQHLQYLPFGETFVEQSTSAPYNTPYKFSAKEKDEETGYSYFGARYLNSDISIWLSVDPMADNAPGWTPYRYCFQNPIRLTDPTGMEEEDGNDPKNKTINLSLITCTADKIHRSFGDRVKTFVKGFLNIFKGSGDNNGSSDDNQDTYVKKGGIRLTTEFSSANNETSISSLGSERVAADLFMLMLKNGATAPKSFGDGWFTNIINGADKVSELKGTIQDVNDKNDEHKKDNLNNNSQEDNSKPISYKVAPFVADSMVGYGDSVTLYGNRGKTMKLSNDAVSKSNVWKWRR